MPYPPTIPAAGQANTTAQLDVHPNLHNQTSAALSALPWGRVDSKQSTSTATITTTFTELLNVAVTAVAGRRYRLSGVINGTTAAVQVVWLELADAANNRVQLASFHATAASLLFTLPVWVEIPPGAAGARTYRLRIATNTGTATLSGGAANPHGLLLEDVGT